MCHKPSNDILPLCVTVSEPCQRDCPDMNLVLHALQEDDAADDEEASEDADSSGMEES